MNSYNKNYLDDLSQQSGFIRDNLEKVMRLANILRYLHDLAHPRNRLIHWIRGYSGIRIPGAIKIVVKS